MSKEGLRMALIEAIEDRESTIVRESYYDNRIQKLKAHLNEVDCSHSVVRYDDGNKYLLVRRVVETDDVLFIKLYWYSMDGVLATTTYDYVSIHDSSGSISKIDRVSMYIEGNYWNELGFNLVLPSDYIDINTGKPVELE